jgi:hypothetical protein
MSSDKINLSNTHNVEHEDDDRHNPGDHLSRPLAYG